MYDTLFVSKFDKSNNSRKEHPWNIDFIVITLDVLNVSKDKAFTYSNLFFKHAFNKIIKEYSIDRIYNDFDGNYFEKMVNDNLLNFIIKI